MNKLLFHLEVDFGNNVTLIANNHKDLEEYLRVNYDWHSIEINEDSVLIKEWSGAVSQIASLTWVKHI